MVTSELNWLQAMSRFPKLGTIDIWGWLILCTWRLSCTLQDIWQTPGLYGLDASNPFSLAVTDKNLSRRYQMSPSGWVLGV